MGLAGRKTSQRQQKEQRRNADVEEQAISKQKQAEDCVWSTTHPTTASVDNMWEWDKWQIEQDKDVTIIEILVTLHLKNKLCN